MKKYEPLNFEEYQCQRVSYLCDNCGCEMEQEPIVLTSFPPMYSYYCPDCGWKMITTESYPRLEFTSRGGKTWTIPE